MANVKISNLTAATTPVAGTEVLPIVQSGATVKVSIANLTAGRAVSVLSLTSTNDSTISGLTVGKGAGAVATNTAVGASALAANTTGAGNVAVGQNALLSNTTANYNNSFGAASLYSNTTGANNVAMGDASLYANTTGSSNTSIGATALRFNTTASNNTAVGYQAGYTNTTGAGNTFAGTQAGYETTGANNTFLGYGSGSAITTGTKNTIIGRNNGNNGLDLRTASNYIVLSDGDGNLRQIIDNNGKILLGGVTSAYAGNGISISSTQNTIWTNCTVQAQHGLVVQNSANSTGTSASFVSFNVGTAGGGSAVGSITYSGTLTVYGTTSDYRLKTVVGAITGQGARLDALKPVDYLWTENGQQSRGFLAHEFQEVYADSVSGTKDAVDADGKPVYQGMQAGTAEVIADLVAEIQSLRKRLAVLESA